MSESNSPKNRMVKVSVHVNEPALLEAAFDRVRRECGYFGLKDVEDIHIHMSVEFSGPIHPRHIPYLHMRLDQLWLANIEKVGVWDAEERAYKSED